MQMFAPFLITQASTRKRSKMWKKQSPTSSRTLMLKQMKTTTSTLMKQQLPVSAKASIVTLLLDLMTFPPSSSSKAGSLSTPSLLTSSQLSFREATPHPHTALLTSSPSSKVKATAEQQQPPTAPSASPVCLRNCLRDASNLFSNSRLKAHSPSSNLAFGQATAQMIRSSESPELCNRPGSTAPLAPPLPKHTLSYLLLFLICQKPLTEYGLTVFC